MKILKFSKIAGNVFTFSNVVIPFYISQIHFDLVFQLETTNLKLYWIWAILTLIILILMMVHNVPLPRSQFRECQNLHLCRITTTHLQHGIEGSLKMIAIICNVSACYCNYHIKENFIFIRLRFRVKTFWAKFVIILNYFGMLLIVTSCYYSIS